MRSIFFFILVRMTTPLTPWDYCVVKRLFQHTFLCHEDKNFVKAWKHRHPTASVGYWVDDVLVGAAIVQHKTLEYIFIHPAFQNQGIGTILLNTVLNNCSTIYLTAVKDQAVRSWYKKHGFEQTGEDTFVHDRRSAVLNPPTHIRVNGHISTPVETEPLMATHGCSIC